MASLGLSKVEDEIVIVILTYVEVRYGKVRWGEVMVMRRATGYRLWALQTPPGFSAASTTTRDGASWENSQSAQCWPGWQAGKTKLSETHRVWPSVNSSNSNSSQRAPPSLLLPPPQSGDPVGSTTRTTSSSSISTSWSWRGHQVGTAGWLTPLTFREFRVFFLLPHPASSSSSLLTSRPKYHLIDIDGVTWWSLCSSPLPPCITSTQYLASSGLLSFHISGFTLSIVVKKWFYASSCVDYKNPVSAEQKLDFIGRARERGRDGSEIGQRVNICWIFWQF